MYDGPAPAGRGDASIHCLAVWTAQASHLRGTSSGVRRHVDRHYLRRFTPYGLAQGPYEEDKVFDLPGLCIWTYAAAVTGTPPGEYHPSQLPPDWLGDVPHTHRAIDDALGYANLLVHLLAMSRK